MTEKEFILKESEKLISEGIKMFPEDFCNLTDAVELNLPAKNLVLGKNFFGTYEVTTTEGETVFNLADLYEAKFIVYSCRERSDKIRMLKDSVKIKEAVSSYESYIDQILNNIKKEFVKENFKMKNLGNISGDILKKINLVRL